MSPTCSPLKESSCHVASALEPNVVVFSNTITCNIRTTNYNTNNNNNINNVQIIMAPLLALIPDVFAPRMKSLRRHSVTIPPLSSTLQVYKDQKQNNSLGLFALIFRAKSVCSACRQFVLYSRLELFTTIFLLSFFLHATISYLSLLTSSEH
jgi:hypothetical protein